MTKALTEFGIPKSKMNFTEIPAWDFSDTVPTDVDGPNAHSFMTACTIATRKISPGDLSYHVHTYKQAKVYQSRPEIFTETILIPLSPVAQYQLYDHVAVGHDDNTEESIP